MHAIYQILGGVFLFHPGAGFRWTLIAPQCACQLSCSPIAREPHLTVCRLRPSSPPDLVLETNVIPPA